MNGSENSMLLDVRGLKKHFPIQAGVFRRVIGHVKAVDDVSFAIKRGETLGLVGESGCGKTTTGRTILRAVDPTAGEVLYHTEDGVVDIAQLEKQQLRQVRRNIQMIFQDPYSSLDPRQNVRDIVGEPLVCNSVARGKSLESRVSELMAAVGLRPEHMVRYPHAFSGGQRQRIGIARALALNPDLIVCDEPVSALDVSIQAQTLNLLQDLQQQFGLTYLFISHDLSVVEHISDRVAVMYVGKLVELAAAEDLFREPKHPYTEALLSALPKPHPKYRESTQLLSGEVADPANPPSGCYFHPRCPYAQDVCRSDHPPLRDVATGERSHWASCHFADELTLAGVE
jgi:peptide/nickel transport system ATP-binding protein